MSAADESEDAIIVSAYFRIPSKTSHEFYVPHVKRFLSSVEAEIVFFTTPDLVEQLRAMRPASMRPVLFVALAHGVHDFVGVRTYGFGFFRDQCAADPEKYHTPELAAVWYEKKEFVKRAIEMVRLNRREDVVDRIPFIWCDAGCIRTDAWLPKVRSFGTGLIRFTTTTTKKLSLQLLNEPPTDKRFFAYPDVHVAGAIIVGCADAWIKCGRLYDRTLRECLLNGVCVTSDQYVWMSTAVAHPDDFDLVLVPSTGVVDRWFYFLNYLLT